MNFYLFYRNIHTNILHYCCCGYYCCIIVMGSLPYTNMRSGTVHLPFLHTVIHSELGSQHSNPRESIVECMCGALNANYRALCALRALSIYR